MPTKATGKKRAAKPDLGAALPGLLDMSKADAFAVVRDAGRYGDPAHAMLLLDALESRLAPGDLDRLARDRADTLTRAEAVWGPVEPRLAWLNRLVEKGADPFAHSGSREKYDHAPSLFEAAICGGFWSFADSLAEASPDSKAKALAVAMALEPHQAACWGLGSKAGPGDAARSLAMEGGPHALALAFKWGLEPHATHGGLPWIFWCQDGPTLQAFIDAGASLSGVDQSGRGLRERIFAVEDAKARDAMLAALDKGPKGPALDPKAAERSIMALARSGSWAEIRREAKACGIDPLAARGAGGDGMFVAALDHGNWRLAVALMEAGVDPMAPCSLGTPAIGRVLWSREEDRSLTVKESAAARAKREAREKALFGGLDLSWRDPQGRKLLEASLASKAAFDAKSKWQLLPSATVGSSAAIFLIDNEPVDPADPLWSRLLAADPNSLKRGDIWLVRRAALARLEEPWMAPNGDSLMATLARAKLGGGVSDNFERRYASRDALAQFIDDLDSKFGGLGPDEDGARRMRFFATEQWEDALAKLWGASSESSGESSIAARAIMEGMEIRLLSALGRWTAESAKLGVEPFDFPRISKALAGLFAANEQGESWGDADRVLAFALPICMEWPDKSGVILLDLLATERSGALEAAWKIWSEAKRRGRKVELPESHDLLERAGAVPPRLANHAIWREMEDQLLAKASRGMRMR